MYVCMYTSKEKSILNKCKNWRCRIEWRLIKVQKQEMVTKFTYCFFLSELTVSKINALLIILQSLLAPYQLLLHKKVYLYNIVMACLTFYWKVRANTHTYPIFLFCLFCFMVQSSWAIDKEWGSNDDHLPPLTMAVTIYFKGLWQDFVQFLCQTKKNSIDRMIKIK